jgi:hypothetical protein
VTPGSLGINGRSSKLSSSYRTTRQILRTELNVLGGAVPDLHTLGDWAAEREAIAVLIESWGQVPHEQIAIAIAVRTNDMASEVATCPRGSRPQKQRNTGESYDSTGNS